MFRAVACGAGPHRLVLRQARWSPSAASALPFRCLSSTSDETKASEAARSISWLSSHVVNHGEPAAIELAGQLSPGAQREISELMRKSSTESQGQVPEPSPRDIRLVALQNAIPFVGFGIMDNSILIIAGDAIDTSLGVALGISTMCAAAIGNIISDVAGVMLGTVIEDFCAGLGLPIPQISAAQRQLRSVRFANQLGCAVGLVIGCIIGMFPLLLIDSNKISRLKQEAQMNAIFSDVVDQARELIGAEATNLYIIVDSKESKTPADPSKKLPAGSQLYFYSKHGHSIHIPIGRGAVSRVARTGKVANIKDDPDVDRAKWEKAFPDVDVKSMIVVPVFNSRGQVIGILQAINKVSRGLTRRDTNYSKHASFTRTDESILKVLASHIAVSLQAMYEEDAEISLKQTISILKEQGLAGLPDQQFLTLPAIANQPNTPHVNAQPNCD